MSVRTRMAPSPTGEYHIGHIRTLLYNYAYSRQQNGKFIIRIEDTDRERYVEGAVQKILEVIKDYGFEWNEGPEIEGPYKPYIQSERLPLYKEKAAELIRNGHAYYCFCTKERLTELREEQKNKGYPSTKYDKKCLSLKPEEVQQKVNAGVPYVIRLNVTPDREITFNDLVYGQITINSNDLDDQVLLKSDGYPTYHLAVVVDDYEMKITHIMRGMDWLPSTPKHVILYEAFGWELPIYAHLPNIKEMGENRKLSKRYGSVFAREFLEEGYLPEALINFLMFLGWNPGTEKEIYSLTEFINDFSIERLQKTDLVSFDRKKLLWYNGQYLRKLAVEELYEVIRNWALKYEYPLVSKERPDDYNIKVLSLVQERLEVLSDYNELVSYYYTKPKIDDNLLHKYTQSESRTLEIIESFYAEFDDLTESEWTIESLEMHCKALLLKHGYSPKEAYMTLRVVLTGWTASPHIFDVLSVLGKTEVIKRIKSVLK